VVTPSGPPPPDDPALDPAVVHELDRSPRDYPPGFYGSIRERLPVFAAVGALSVLVALIPFPHSRTIETVIAGGVFFLLTGAALVIPWTRIPQWFWPVIPIGYIGVVALLRDAQGGGGSGGSGLAVLLMLPIVWLAFYGSVRQLLAGITALVLALVIPLVAVGAPEYPASQWRLVLVTSAVGLLIAFSFLTMVSRDRRYVGDVAAQSLLAQENARKATEAREQLESLLRAATETAVVGTDQLGVITFFSVGAERMLGYAAADVVGRVTFAHFLDPEELRVRAAERGGDPPGMWLLADGIAPRPDLGRSWTYIRSDGSRRRAALNVTQPGEDAQFGYVAVATDVTEREQMAAQRERLFAIQRELTQSLVEQNQRLRELTKVKDDVVATVSHELRTPLTSIRGFVELLLDSGPEVSEEERRRMLRIIDRNSQQLLRVAEDLLSEASATWRLHVEFIHCDLAQLTREACDAMAAIAAARRVTLTAVAADPVIVLGDPARLHQLLANLLSNACKFTPAGGRVVAQADVVGDFARLEVRDDGPGIPAENRPQLFERFYRVANSRAQGVEGTGLGLAIAKAVVDAHDGAIDIVDRPGWSTTFRVLLPSRTGPAAGPATRAAVPGTAPSRPTSGRQVDPEPSLLPGRPD
jgi:PAS domain S-box-containing protein